MQLFKKSTTQTTVESIVAPIGRIVADLKAFVEAESEKNVEKMEQIRQLEAEVDASSKEAERASGLAKKYEGFLA